MKVDTKKIRRTAEAFGLEWTKHGALAKLYLSEVQLFEEFHRYGIPSDFFERKLVLDAGCGMGRYSYVAAKLGARGVVGFDLHDGIYAGSKLTAPFKRVHLLKANIFDLPFKPETFDALMSIGVLHHTGDPHGAFKELVKLLRPGGRIFVQVYETRGPQKDRRNDILLTITNRIPKRLLYLLCFPLVALMYIPLLKSLVRLVLRYVTVVSYSKQRTFLRNVADTYDWHACPFRTFHTWEEMERLFGECGLVNVHITNYEYKGALNILGEKPAVP